MNRTQGMFVALLVLAAAPLGAQEGIEGRWRVAGAESGVLDVRRASDGSLRYVRRAGATAGDRPAPTEAGRVLPRQDGGVRFVADAGPGVTNRLVGRWDEARPATSDCWRSAAGWTGVRRVGQRLQREQLVAWRPDRDGHEVTLLIDGEAFPPMRAAIDGARELIEVQTFHWADDDLGRGIARQLIAKAQAGVRVRCLIDAASKTVHHYMKKKDVTEGLVDEMRRGGVEVIVAHGYVQGVVNSIVGAPRRVLDGLGRLFGREPPPRERRGFMNHDHRKLLVVDRAVAFCGGMNISREYEHDWHDVVAQVAGPAAWEAHRMFVDRWQAAGGRGAGVGARPPAPAGGDVQAVILGNLPGVDRALTDRFLREIEQARERVLIEVAYFLDDRVIDALTRAVARGVRVVLIIPSDATNDVYLVREAFAWVHNDVVRAGIELYFYPDRLTHAKVAAWDGVRATVGSCNLDRVALDLVAEANFFFDDRRVTRTLEQRVFLVDLKRSIRAVERDMPWRRKIVSGTLHVFRGFL